MNDIKPLTLNGQPLDKPYIISGPCSAETPEQTIDTARRLAQAGIKVFRAGIWKPRTKPGGFEGIGSPALEWMAEVKKATSMLTAVEVANKAHVEAALSHGIDILWIGARTTGNPFAVQEIADVLASAPDTPVLVKNPMNPDLELWIGALERLYNAGLRHLGAIHRGFSIYGKHIFRNQPQWRIPLELRRRIPALPIICDPSHLGGKRELIAPLSQQALDMGFDGLIIESHCRPECAWSDKDQQITPEALAAILKNLVVRGTSSTNEELRHLREQIDILDTELLDILDRRMQVCRQIGQYKKAHAMPVVQPGRYDQLMTERVNSGIAAGLSEDFLRTILTAIHEESVTHQLKV